MQPAARLNDALHVHWQPGRLALHVSSARVVRWPCTELGTCRSRTRGVPLAEPLALHPTEHGHKSAQRARRPAEPAELPMPRR
jgi:hypothetical protein